MIPTDIPTQPAYYIQNDGEFLSINITETIPFSDEIAIKSAELAKTLKNNSPLLTFYEDEWEGISERAITAYVAQVMYRDPSKPKTSEFLTSDIAIFANNPQYIELLVLTADAALESTRCSSDLNEFRLALVKAVNGEELTDAEAAGLQFLLGKAFPELWQNEIKYKVDLKIDDTYGPFYVLNLENPTDVEGLINFVNTEFYKNKESKDYADGKKILTGCTNPQKPRWVDTKNTNKQSTPTRFYNANLNSLNNRQ